MFEPKDIFAETLPTEAEPLRPRGAVSPTVPGRPGEPAPVGATPPAPPPEAAPAPRRKSFLIIIAVVLILILGLGGYFVWSQFAKKPVQEITPVQEVINVNVPFVPPAEVAPGPPAAICGNEICETGETSTNCPDDCPLSPPVLVEDTDLDGLSDDEELTLGTDPTKIDSDEDNLSDREEVQIYMTDPLNPDTDNDTYLDGDEVRAGYNPKGPGKLFSLPQ